MTATERPTAMADEALVMRPISPLAVIIITLIMSAIYSAFTTGSLGRCLGGYDADGGFVDSAGQPSPTPPACLQVDFYPQSYVFVIMALVCVVGLALAVTLLNRGAGPALVRQIQMRSILLIVGVGLIFTIAQLPQSLLWPI